MSEIEQAAFENMARTYPREIYDLNPEKFWEFFQRECPGISREGMESWIADAPYYADAELNAA